MTATKIRMKENCALSNNLLEIDSIYLVGTGNDGFHKKAVINEYLTEKPRTIQVCISPYPFLRPMTGPAPDYEKYVKSIYHEVTGDTLLSLPRS